VTDESPPNLVDDHYWLGRAAKLIEEAVDVKRATADRLVHAVAWLATAFVLFATTFFATKLTSPSHLVLGVCSGTALIVISAYLVAVHAASPTYVEFDPRVPAEIESAYSEMATTARKRIRVASATTVAAAVGVMASLVVLIASQSSTASRPQLHATLESGRQSTVVVSGEDVGANQDVVVTVIPDQGAARSVTSRVDDRGDFAADVIVEAASSYRARVAWTTDDGAVVTIESAVR
jgi:hypothetical protein